MSFSYENRGIQILCGDCYHHTSGTMNAVAPEGTPRGGSVTKSKKNSLPAVHRRGPEEGSLRRENDFHSSGVNRIDSSQFLHSHIILILIIKDRNFNQDFKRVVN